MKKLPLLVPFVFATLFAATPVFAQSEPREAEAPKKEAAVAPYGPREQVNLFFSRLTEGRVDAAYDGLLKGTKIAESPKDVATLKAKTREAIRVFGDINGADFVSEQKVGNNTSLAHLERLTYLSLGKQFPIRWRFYFYNAESNIARDCPENAVRTNGIWKLIDIRIDDRLLDMFEEPAPAKSAPAK